MAGGSSSLADTLRVLNDELGRLLDLEFQKDNEFRINITPNKDKSSKVFKHWKERVSNIQNQVASLNTEYDETGKKKGHFHGRQGLKEEIERARNDVIKLLEECPEKTVVPSLAMSRTLYTAFKDIQDLLQKNGVKCVALDGESRREKREIMQKLENYFYDMLFDMVIFVTVPSDGQTEDLHILQKIADRVRVDREGDEFEVSGRIKKVLENKRYSLILDGVRRTLDGIWEKLDISNDKKDSKVVITTRNPLPLCSKCIDSKVKLQPSYSSMMLRQRPAKLASSREGEKGEMSSMFAGIFHSLLPLHPELSPNMPGSAQQHESSTSIEDRLQRDLLKLMKMRDFVHLILSYPMKIGYEGFLKQWINDVYQLSFADDGSGFDRSIRVEYLLSESPLRSVQVLIPQEITEKIINGSSVSMETPLKHVPQSILLARLAVRQLTQTLTSDTAQAHFQNIWFSTRDDAEKLTVVKNIQADSPIGDLQIIDLNQIDDQNKRELALFNPATWLEQTTSVESPTKNYRRSRRLVLVVDGDGNKKLDPLWARLPISRDSSYVVVFITTLSSNNHLTNNVDLTIKTEDHLLPWELFCKNVGGELLHSSTAIQRIAVQIVEKCGGHLLAIIFMAKSLKDVKDVKIWELALRKLCYLGREPIMNAFFHIISVDVISEAEKENLLRYLFQNRYWKTSDNDKLASWFSSQLIDLNYVEDIILQNIMEFSFVLRFQDTLGLQCILLPEDINIILHVFGEEILGHFSEGALASTISDVQVLNLSNTHMQNLYLGITGDGLQKLNLEGCMLKTLPKAIFKICRLETLSLEHCSHLRELPPQISELYNIKTLNLAGCEQLETLPEAIFNLRKLETLSLKHCSRLRGLPPQIAKLKRLKTLSLAGCEQLETLPQEIWELPNLQTLSLAWTSIFRTSKNQELFNSNYSLLLSSGYHKYSGLGKKGNPSSSSTIIPVGLRLKLTVRRGFEFEKLCQKIVQLHIQNLETCNLSGTHITHLPEFLNFPQLKILLLGNNLNLMKIPFSFFDHVPLLTILNLSCTSIHELPSSIFKLRELREFYLKDCELFLELPPEIGQLSNLTTLDLHGTLITHLPKEMEKLANLESLSLSFYNDDSSSVVIPPGILSKLTHLEVLRIGVNSDNKWWFNNIRHILAEINGLERLRELDMFMPEVDSLSIIERSLYNFRFIIGHHKPRMVSRVLPAMEVTFEESSPSVKLVCHQVFPDEVKPILSEAWAFFLDRHMTINNLADFGLENLKQVRLCILAECNEMRTIVDMDKCEADLDLNESFAMRFLTVFYMKHLRSIVNNPIPGNSIFCKLNLLSLHTCPELTTVFTMHSLHNLVNLEELIVADCPQLNSIINCSSSEERTTEIFLPKLRKLSLLFIPKLTSISNGVRIGKNLEQMGLHYCPKLRNLTTAELSSERLKVIKGETKWWEELQWSEAEWGQEHAPHKFKQIFSQIDEGRDILTQLTKYELTSFNRENDSGEEEESDSELLGGDWE